VKTSTPPTTGVVKFNKVSQFETNAAAQAKQAINDKLAAIVITFDKNVGWTAEDHTNALRVLVEEFNSLCPAEATPEARKAYLADATKRKANGKDAISYELFLCTHGLYAKKRYAMVAKGLIAEADVQLASIRKTVEKMLKLDAALTQRTK
jgi:hypothetical protein